MMTWRRKAVEMIMCNQLVRSIRPHRFCQLSLSAHTHTHTHTQRYTLWWTEHLSTDAQSVSEWFGGGQM